MSQIVASYDYTDERGGLLFQTLRYEPKSFRQRRPDVDGGWAYHLDGTRRVLYRLPEVVEGVKAGRWIVVVEGEKDADRLAQLGPVATTSPMGAGKWLDEYSKGLKGAKVAIIPDNDEPGRKHAELVAQSVSKAEAAKVVVVELDGLPDKGDVSDWLEQGHTPNELKTLITEAKPWEPKGVPASKVEANAGNRASILGALACRPHSTRALLRAVEIVLRRYVVFAAPAQVTATALWVLHTYPFEAFETTPYLAVTSAAKRCGKSQLLELASLLVARPWLVIEPTEATLFRTVDARRPTLLVDETDATFGKDSSATEGLRAIYNAGYRKGAAVPRCVGTQHEVRDFEVFCPKAFAGIKSLPDTVADRSVPIVLQRRAPHDRKPRRFRFARVRRQLEPLRGALEAWGAAHLEALTDAYPDLPEALSDRAQDGWEPLLAIADLAGGPWPVRAREAAKELHCGVEEVDLGTRLLMDCRDAFDALAVDERLPTGDLLGHLIDRGDDSPWAAWWAKDLADNRPKGPASKLARMLKVFGPTSEQMWVDGKNERGYKRSDFEPAWARYAAPAEAAKQGLAVPSNPQNARTLGRRSEAISGEKPGHPKMGLDQDSSVLAFEIGKRGVRRVSEPEAHPTEQAPGTAKRLHSELADCACGRPTVRRSEDGRPRCQQCEWRERSR